MCFGCLRFVFVSVFFCVSVRLFPYYFGVFFSSCLVLSSYLSLNLLFAFGLFD